MTELLLRLFVKNYRHTQDPAVRSAVGKLAGITGIICNILLFGFKLTAGLMSGAVSIIADAVNNLTDASSSVVTLLGFRMAQQPADEDHPYGHARYEYLSGLIVAALILLIGAELAKDSMGRIINPAPVDLSITVFVILVCSIAVKLWMFLFFSSLGKRIGSTALYATAVDSRSDAIASGAVLIGCLTGFFLRISIDGYVGLAVALFILYSGYDTAKKTISPLLGQQADSELIENINRLILSREKVLGIHDLLVHDYGPGRCFASVHVEISAEEAPMHCHEIIDDIERAAMRELNVHLVIHYDPVVMDDEERDQVYQATEEIIHRIDPQLSMHDFRLVRRDTGKTVNFDLAVPFALKRQPEELKQAIDAALLQRGLHYTTCIHFDSK